MNIRKNYFRCMAVVMMMVACAIPAYKSSAADVETANVQQVAEQTVVNEQTDAQQTVTNQEQLQVALANVTAEQAGRQLVFIGDSRTVGMNTAIGKDGNLWSAKVGMGLSWMKSTGVPAVESKITANSDVVILMGVNDVRSLSYTDKYIKYINEKADAWTALGANVYYVSVNPITFESSAYPGISNDLIAKWNDKMQKGLNENVKYIDTYSQVLGQLNSNDGMHYNKSSYKKIYSLIQQGIINDKLTTEYNVMI